MRKLCFLITLIVWLCGGITMSAQRECIHRLATGIDSVITQRRAAHIDSDYIATPKHKLLVSTGFTNSWTSNEIYIPLTFGDYLTSRHPQMNNYDYLRVRNYTYTSGITFKVNYSGFSLGYTAIVSDGGNHQSFELGSNGRRFGFRAGVRRQSLDNGTLSDYRWLVPMVAMAEVLQGDVDVDEEAKKCVASNVDDRVKMLSWYAHAYYAFNNKKFCMGATLNPSTLQRRSAGSVLVTADVSSTRLHAENTLFNDREKFSCFAAALGAGYAYNWTPNQGRLLLHASLMPAINLYTRIGYNAFVFRYDDHDGKLTYDKERRNEKIPIVGHNKVSLALSGTVRLGLCYNFTDRIVGAINTECTLRNKNSNASGSYIYNTRLQGSASIGYRF